MKKIILSLLILAGLCANKTNAQMAAARPVNWDIAKSVDINMEFDNTWEIFNNNELLKKASNGYVTTIEVIDASMPVSRKVIFANGSSRVENITQNEPHNKLMSMEFAETSLPKGIKSAMVVLFFKAKDAKTNIIWRALVKGDDEAKKALVAQLTTEIDSYAVGLDKMTKKVIPAARMN